MKTSSGDPKNLAKGLVNKIIHPPKTEFVQKILDIKKQVSKDETFAQQSRFKFRDGGSQAKIAEKLAASKQAYLDLTINSTPEQNKELMRYNFFFYLRITLPIIIVFIILISFGLGSANTARENEVPNVVGMGCKDAIAALKMEYFSGTCSNEQSNEYKITSQSLTGIQTTIPANPTNVELTDDKQLRDKISSILDKVDGMDALDAINLLKAENVKIEVLLKGGESTGDNTQNIINSAEVCKSDIDDPDCYGGKIISHNIIDSETIQLVYNFYADIKAEEERVAAEAESIQLKKGMDEATAMTLCQHHFGQIYSYKGSEIHSIMGNISAMDWNINMKSYYWKVTATIGNAFGGAYGTTIECKVIPSTADSGTVQILNYDLMEMGWQ